VGALRNAVPAASGFPWERSRAMSLTTLGHAAWKALSEAGCSGRALWEGGGWGSSVWAGGGGRAARDGAGATLGVSAQGRVRRAAGFLWASPAERGWSSGPRCARPELSRRISEKGRGGCVPPAGKGSSEPR